MAANIKKNQLELTMEFVIDSIENNKAFSTLKICHGFWELNVKFNEEIKRLRIIGEPSFEEWAVILNKYNANWPVELFLELKSFLKSAHDTPRLFNLVSEFGWKNCWEIERTPLVGLEETRSVIKNILSPKAPLYDGLFWKNAVYDGSFVEFIEVIRNRPVVIVGPNYVKDFASFAGISNSVFIEVSRYQAAWERSKILEMIIDAHRQMKVDNVICLIEAGGATSSWLVLKLFPEFPRSFFFALGQVLNLCNFSKLDGINWFEVQKKNVCKTIKKINPEWPKTHNSYIDEQIESKDLPLYWYAQKNGYDKQLFLSLKSSLEKSNRYEKSGLCSYIENKSLNYSLLEEILSLSKNKNHWANYGPVSEFLESNLVNIMQVNKDKSIILCKSATQAMHSLVHMYEIKAGKPLRWVVSSFGFISTGIGPLAKALIIDCDAKGVLDIEELKLLDINSWDAVIVTNTFGLCQSIRYFIDFCLENNKLLLMDNAMAFLTDTRKEKNAPCEVVSFHQTKPWGMGEGGCAIVQKEDEVLFRSLLNFGVGLADSSRKYSSNGKLSDYDSALILQRLINRHNWQPLYRMQARRINRIAILCGLTPLMPYSRDIISGNLPFLASYNIPIEALDNPWLVLKKYYIPLNKKHTRANDIYNRIVNIPCHSQVAEVTEKNIVKAIDKLNNNNTKVKRN